MEIPAMVVYLKPFNQASQNISGEIVIGFI